MHGELSGASTRRHSLADSADIGDRNDSLDLLLVDVEDSVVSDGDHAFLRPLKLVDLLDHCRVHKGVYKDKS